MEAVNAIIEKVLNTQIIHSIIVIIISFIMYKVIMKKDGPKGQ